MLKAIAFDWGHTLMDERRDEHLPLEARAVHLMPGVAEILPRLTYPLALWANTRVANEADLRAWLERAGLGDRFEWVITSVDAGVRKPDPAYFRFALDRMRVAAADMFFIGNQLNTDIAGAEGSGIRSVWLSGEAYRSPDDRPCDARPTCTIDTLHDLPDLLQRL